MKRFYIIAMAMSFLLLGYPVEAQVPQILNYQGRVSVNGTNFDGTGQFQFALVDGTGTVTYWSNGNSVVSLPVSGGLYSVSLGDTNVSNMAAIPVNLFTNTDVRLRV
jgi:microcystin-dependent protein